MTAAVPPPIARAPRESPMGVVEGCPGYWCGNCTLLAYQGKDIVFRFIIEYSSLRDFSPQVIIIIIIIIGIFIFI
jgi:hypothetical protein